MRAKARSFCLQYILGYWDFCNETYRVTEDTLIPRQDTEKLVELAIKLMPAGARFIDLCTGSGCIAWSMALELHGSDVTAVDISEGALEVASRNCERNEVKVLLRQKDVLKAAPEGDLYDVIVSNPPYITNKEKTDMEANVLDWEPSLALFVPDEDPLLFYRKIAQLGCDMLKEGGSLYFEINRAYGEETILMLKELGYAQIELKKDSWGNDRMIKAKR